ncbi:quinone oxidoreductase [Micrococcus porci]|uniref:quinone oxidoreductase family protein n=1 Tax=Micrococcus TaxID=1269 RepID=UPI001CCF17FF|nr:MULTISPECIES: quinone oxidoreductase [Micrococcus]MCG7422608.1 quinone oxidoreductase [Micrococcus sp. ACRRV]UBH23633.1 quinone oxidoreductase [Micrococcus porci]
MSTHAEIPARHHAIIAEEVGGPEVLRWTETAVPTPGAGEVLVRTAAAGLNFIETYQRSGVYAVPHPFTPGSEGSGVVVALGPGVDEALRGARVATAAGRGTYAEHFTAPADQLLHVPAGVDLADAAALPLQGMTAHYLCRSTFPVEPGHVVALTAGAGGVGLLLTQLAAARGATVITAASTEDKRALSAAAGASAAVPYAELRQTVLDATGGEGAHAVFDGVGADTFEDSLASLRVRGTLVLFGGASGQVPPFDLQRLNSGGGLYVTRPSLAHYTRTAEETAWRGRELFDAWSAGALDVRIGARVPLAEAGRAHTLLASRATTGKVLLPLS